MSGRPVRAAVPSAAAKILGPLAEEARARGTPLYAVGGPVRDWLMRRSNFDLDLTVAGDPDPIAAAAARLLGGRVEAFGRFGTRRIVSGGKFRVDVATTRSESYPKPACLPVVQAVRVPIERDLFRRDFTINALAMRLDDGSHALTDPYGGLRDMKARVLRVLHPASFRDDPTRVFRAARFLGRFGYRPAAGMVDEAKAALAAGHAARLSAHRLLHELVSLLGERDPRAAFALLKAWGYSGLLHPALPLKPALPPGVEPRLAALALGLGPARGRTFVDAFPHEHKRRTRLHETLELAFSDKSPRVVCEASVAASVRRFFPKLPPSALKPRFLAGSDLIAAGLKPGPDFHGLLDEAARLQRAGELTTRAAARAWLKKRLRPAIPILYNPGLP
ncbi:MAG: CCA tRNA nucleotidyltransferase [Elusimicrobia bacterium]|nr:CCA tRNA nucleotidyltransferase [Elusimicrobiota bacterium]